MLQVNLVDEAFGTPLAIFRFADLQAPYININEDPLLTAMEDSNARRRSFRTVQPLCAKLLKKERPEFGIAHFLKLSGPHSLSTRRPFCNVPRRRFTGTHQQASACQSLPADETGFSIEPSNHARNKVDLATAKVARRPPCRPVVLVQASLPYHGPIVRQLNLQKLSQCLSHRAERSPRRLIFLQPRIGQYPCTSRTQGEQTHLQQLGFV